MWESLSLSVFAVWTHTNGSESCHAELVRLKYCPRSDEKGLYEVVLSTEPAKNGVGRTLVHPGVGAQVAQPRTVPAPPSSQRCRYALHKPRWFGVFLKGLSELLGAYNHDSLEPWVLEGCFNRGTWQRTSIWAQCQAAEACTWASSQRWLMSELGEKPPQVEGYLLGVHTEIRNSLFMSPFFSMMWDWFSLCLRVLHSSPWLKSISSLTLMDLHQARRETQTLCS